VVTIKSPLIPWPAGRPQRSGRGRKTITGELMFRNVKTTAAAALVCVTAEAKN
jgi:hypothetical protein